METLDARKDRRTALERRARLDLGWSPGFFVHLFTAAGAACGLIALAAAADRSFLACFAWLGLALIIDGADGVLARRLRVRETAPRIDGAELDLVVDYLTYVIVPLFAVWRSLEGASPLGLLVCASIAAAGSALYFADVLMKTEDLWFRGFPACWNILAVYYFAFRPPLWATDLSLLLFTALLFAPVASVHPLRVARARSATLAVSLAWLVCAAVALGGGNRFAAASRIGLALCGLYFIGLSLAKGAIGKSRLHIAPPG